MIARDVILRYEMSHVRSVPSIIQTVSRNLVPYHVIEMCAVRECCYTAAHCIALYQSASHTAQHVTMKFSKAYLYCIVPFILYRMSCCIMSYWIALQHSMSLHVMSCCTALRHIVSCPVSI